jgi:hypothetical protein
VKSFSPGVASKEEAQTRQSIARSSDHEKASGHAFHKHAECGGRCH